MSVAALKKPKIREMVIDKTLTTLLEELGEECWNISKLLAQLKMRHLSAEQIEDILAELTGSVVHLHVHTDGLDDLISDQLEKF
jgi:hypothetical protein